MIKDIKCIICDCNIIKPKIGQLYCDKAECKEEFNNNQIELWKLNNPDKVKEMNNKAYSIKKLRSMGIIE
jgi:hypothetical protein